MTDSTSLPKRELELLEQLKLALAQADQLGLTLVAIKIVEAIDHLARHRNRDSEGFGQLN